MRLSTESGDKVIYSGSGGTDWDKEKAQKLLTIGGEYIVSYVEVYDSTSEVYLQGFSEPFNTVMFENIPGEFEETVVKKILENLSSRSGFSNIFDAIDEDIKAEIIQELEDIVFEEFKYYG